MAKDSYERAMWEKSSFELAVGPTHTHTQVELDWAAALPAFVRKCLLSLL